MLVPQRIPIEFLSAQYGSQERKSEFILTCESLSRLMKILIFMATMSPSELFLSEVAHFVMTTQLGFNPQVLQEILDRFAVNKVELG